MYSRNLGKGVVRASPSYTNRSYELPSTTNNNIEDKYGYNIPPGYVGSRFSRQSTVNTEMKLHNPNIETIPSAETANISENNLTDESDNIEVVSDTDKEIEIGAEYDYDETNIAENDKSTDSELITDNPDDSAVPVSVTVNHDDKNALRTINNFLGLLKGHVSNDDILLIIIILLLAVAGEDAELSILLLSLILLVK